MELATFAPFILCQAACTSSARFHMAAFQPVPFQTVLLSIIVQVMSRFSAQTFSQGSDPIVLEITSTDMNRKRVYLEVEMPNCQDKQYKLKEGDSLPYKREIAVD